MVKQASYRHFWGDVSQGAIAETVSGLTFYQSGQELFDPKVEE
ncbi:hypothetical protein SPB21_03090 [Leptothoe sp. ISB3NOV94-8A]|nr:hypothetical protein [Adonisia turfae]MDV3350037.1 hypothetical protein [Leptothoe sp. LEGE 181152]